MSAVSKSFQPQSDVSLKRYNSMAVDARARYLVEISSLRELQQALTFADDHKLPLLVLGEGSNSVFIADYQGLVIVNRMRGIEVLDESEHTVEIKVAAGENWHSLVAYTLANNWFGLENLALIPGLSGAAPMQNIGAYGVELSDVLCSVEFFQTDEKTLRNFTAQQCQFGYRDSWFKRQTAGSFVITSMVLRLSKIASVNIEYPSLAQQFSSPPSPQQVFDAVCALRSSKLPLPSEIPNAGSFFKNPIVANVDLARVKNQHHDVVSFVVGDEHKLAAAWLIERAGWKQQEYDGVRVHQQQALVIINPHHRPGNAVIGLAKSIQADIEQKFGVVLEIEPRVHGSGMSC